jgi:hypothetical protein
MLIGVSQSRGRCDCLWRHTIPLIAPLFFLAWLFGVLVEPGDLGSSDVARRLQVAHSLWTNDRQVLPDDPDWTMPLGRDGLRRVPWGIGQSLVMLPADVVASAAVSFLALPESVRPKVREALVGYLTFPVISAAALAVAVLVLRRLEFSGGQSMAGGIALFFGTSLFPYTQIHQENSCLVLLDLIGFYGVLSWATTRTGSYLAMTGAALGLSILMRLTSMLDLAAITAFLLLVSPVANGDGKYRTHNLISDFGKYVVPFVALAFAIDRTYQFYRFGTWTDTYVDRFAHQVLAVHPGLPQNWPWVYPFWDGVYLILISPERSIFLFDPLLLITLWISVRHWKNLARPVRNFVIAAALLLGFDVALCACHHTPVGASTWGSRFTTTPVILLAMLAVPLVMDKGPLLLRVEMVLSILVIGLATAVQLLSVPIWYQLEEAQMHDAGSGFVIGMRLINVLAIILGKFHDWRLVTPSVTPRYLKLNFAPFLLDKYISVEIVHKFQLVWTAAVVLAFAATVRLVLLCSRFARQTPNGSQVPDAMSR